jgi:catechol 2,3-dioxygenase-like lactoylglutathione lyase family enzyme
MKHGIAEIDHLLTYVADLDRAAAAYRRLGFALSPESDIEAMGIVNRLALFRPRQAGTANFIELMAARNRTKLPPVMAGVLSGAEGVKSMVMMTPDAHAAQEELVADGYPFASPVHVRREWVIPGEGSVWPEFDVLLPIPAPLGFNACQYHTLDLYLRQDWQVHPNTAQHLLCVLAVADDVPATVAWYERLFGARARQQRDGGWHVTPGTTDLAIYSQDNFARCFPDAPGFEPLPAGGAAYRGYRIAVASMAEAARCFTEAGVPAMKTSDGLAVGPADACGNIIEFVPA